MRLLVFGSTGSVGVRVVEQALDLGHVVGAFTRDPERLAVEHSNLRVFQGDAMDAPSVEEAMRGQEVVLCSLGAGRKGIVRSEGTRNIVRTMQEAGVRRLICQTTLGVGDSQDNLNFFWKYIMFGALLRPAYEDHVLQEDYVKRSGLDWILVRPGAFTDGELTGEYRHGFASTDRSIKLKISRADVADFMLRQITDDTYMHQTPGVSY